MIRKLALALLPLAFTATPASAWCGAAAGAYTQNCERGVTVYRARTALPDPAVALAFRSQDLQRDALRQQSAFQAAQLRLQARSLRDARSVAARGLSLAEREQSLLYTRGIGGFNAFGGFGGGFGVNDPFLPPPAFRGFVDTNARAFPRTDVSRDPSPGARRERRPATRIPGSQAHPPH